MKIFMLHKGRRNYVKLALKELIKHNSPKDIVFFTDDKKASKHYFGFDITYENISDYFTMAEEFKKIYNHRSENAYEYELICLQRRLIFLEYMEKHNIESCRQIDSDVLVFCDLIDYANKYLKDYNFCCVASSGGTFYGDRQGLRQFKDFLFDVYKNRMNVLDGFFNKEWYPIHERNNGFIEHEKTWCVSDMTLFYLFIKENLKGVKYKDIGMINNNTVFDDNINRGVGFKHGKYTKALKLIDGNYYGSLEGRKDNDSEILFNLLHFQGDAKPLIKYYSERNLGIGYYLSLYYNKIIHKNIIKLLNQLQILPLLVRIYHWIKPVK